MDYRPLGNTGLNVSALGLGGSSLGGVFRDIDEGEAIRTVHVALDGGMNVIDVSPYYGNTGAETVLGRALKEIPRDRYHLATKCGRYGDPPDGFDFSAERVTRSVDESLARLGVDHLDILQVHDIEYGDLEQVIEETIPALQRLREAGKTRFIGITGLPLKIFTEVAGRLPAGTIDTILSYCRYELNNTTLTRILPLMEEKGVGVMSASPVGMGLLTDRGSPPWHPAQDEVKRVCAAAAAHCAAKGENISRLAMRFAVAEPRICTTFVGSANPKNIRDNLDWIEQPMDEQLLREVLVILEPIRDVIWQTGRPENN